MTAQVCSAASSVSTPYSQAPLYCLHHQTTVTAAADGPQAAAQVLAASLVESVKQGVKDAFASAGECRASCHCEFHAKCSHCVARSSLVFAPWFFCAALGGPVTSHSQGTRAALPVDLMQGLGLDLNPKPLPLLYSKAVVDMEHTCEESCVHDAGRTRLKACRQLPCIVPVDVLQSSQHWTSPDLPAKLLQSPQQWQVPPHRRQQPIQKLPGRRWQQQRSRACHGASQTSLRHHRQVPTFKAVSPVSDLVCLLAVS